MKNNSEALLAKLANDDLGVFFLVFFGFNQPHFFTTLPYDLSWNGNIYVTERNLIDFESPRATTVVDRQTYKLRLSALDPVMMAEVENGIIHMPVEIKLGFVIDGAAQTGLNDMYHVYSGTVANTKKQVNDGEQSLNIECSAPLSSLDAKSTLFTTRDALKAFDPTDTAFDQIFEGSTEFSLKWGQV
ncbi:MAG: hypothetical protein II336_15245 [Loktanella sp.]|nr:hypothetical protein [Loktanella sp.]